MSSLASPRGFTLFETLIATGILVTALAGVAQLVILSSHLTRQANVAGTALIAAQDKLEALVGLTFIYDASGAAVTEAALATSPASSLDEDSAPYVDWLTTSGERRDRPDDAVFVRRWRVVPVDEGIPDSLAIEVCVFRMPAVSVSARSADACLSTVRTRQP